MEKKAILTVGSRFKTELVLDGLQTLCMLRAIDSNATLIMVSFMATQASVSDCQAAGAKNYILKPFDEEKVIAIRKDARLT